jgi:hypothetical protein
MSHYVAIDFHNMVLPQKGAFGSSQQACQANKNSPSTHYNGDRKVVFPNDSDLMGLIVLFTKSHFCFCCWWILGLFWVGWGCSDSTVQYSTVQYYYHPSCSGKQENHMRSHLNLTIVVHHHHTTIERLVLDFYSNPLLHVRVAMVADDNNATIGQGNSMSKN